MQFRSGPSFPPSPIATYTYNGNQTAAPTAIDTTAYTITANAHGFVNGDKIFPMFNDGQWTTSSKYPTGIGQQVYYVINATANTFQISTTSGGSAVSITDTTNLGNFHFEKAAVSSITLNSLGSLSKCSVRALVYSSTDNTSYGYDIRPTEFTQSGDFTYNPLGGGNLNLGRIGSQGSVIELLIDSSLKRKWIRALYLAGYYNATPAQGSDLRISTSVAANGSTFASMYLGFYGALSNIYIANGTRLEVYKQ